MNNYEAERAMNQKRLRMEDGGHSVVQGNGLPLNYMDNGHQIPYQPYAGAYNAHYPPPEAFGAYPPPPGGYAPQNLSYAPPAHQNYAPPHHQAFQQPMQHVPPTQQAHMPSQVPASTSIGYPPALKAAPVPAPSWSPAAKPTAPPPELQKQIIKQEVKLEPSDARPPPDALHTGDIDQPKIKIKTDLFKPDQEPVAAPPEKLSRTEAATVDPSNNVLIPPLLAENPIPKTVDAPIATPEIPSQADDNSGSSDKPVELRSAEALVEAAGEGGARISDSGNSTDNSATNNQKFPGFSDGGDSSDDESKIPNDVYFGTPDLGSYRPKLVGAPSNLPSALEPKKRGRPKGSVNQKRDSTGSITSPVSSPPHVTTPVSRPVVTPVKLEARAPGGSPLPPVRPFTPSITPPTRPSVGRPRGGASYQYTVRPFRKDFSGIQFRRRWSDDCLDSSHIPNEVYFGDVPVRPEVLFNYYDANVEKEKAAAVATHAAAHKAALAKMAAAKMSAARLANSSEVTTVDSSSDDSSSGSDSSDSDDDQPLKRRGPGRPRGAKTQNVRRPSDGSTPARRGRPPVPPELRGPGVTDMKKFCTAAGIKFDYKKITADCKKNKERVDKLLKLLTDKGLEGKPTMEKCRALREEKQRLASAKRQEKKPSTPKLPEDPIDPESRRVTRGQVSSNPRKKIVISSDEDDDTVDTRRTLSQLRSMVDDEGSD